MKRRKGRIILGTTAVAAALTFGGCTGGNNPSAEAGSSAAVTVQESTQEQPRMLIRIRPLPYHRLLKRLRAKRMKKERTKTLKFLIRWIIIM